MTADILTVRSLHARAVNVPMARPLHTSGGAVTTVPLVLIDLHTEQGISGHSYVFGYTPLALTPLVSLLDNLADTLTGDAIAPLAIEEKLQRMFRLLGTPGFAGMALAGVDMAAWDALARAARLPLARLLGGELNPIPAYNSNGLGIIGPERAADEARELIEGGFTAMKVRLGYPSVADDIAVVRAVRDAVGKDVRLMSDYNQSLTVPEAQQRVQALAGEGLYWIEEPTRWDDYAGHARIREKAGVPIQLGENCWGPHEMAKALAANAGDFFMPDAMKIGGVSGWLRAAALAEPVGLPLSCHLFPEISAHLLAVTPTRHWLEYVDWVNPILRTPLTIRNGHALIAATPGSGLDWDETAVARYQL